MPSITINIDDRVSPQVSQLIAKLRDRTGLHQAMGADVANTVREHVLKLAPTSHNTARRLGASPSNFVGAAAQSIEKPSVDKDGFKLRLSHPFFARAFGDVSIRPKSGTYLTIPLIAPAYNQRAYRVSGLFFWRNKKTGKSFLAESVGGAGTGVKAKLRLWYLLVEGVIQARQRERLPSDASILSAALRGAVTYFEFLRSRLNPGVQPSPAGPGPGVRPSPAAPQ